MVLFLMACTPQQAGPENADNGAVEILLEDVNPTSATFGQTLGPGNQSHLVSAWYFGHAT